MHLISTLWIPTVNSPHLYLYTLLKSQRSLIQTSLECAPVLLVLCQLVLVESVQLHGHDGECTGFCKERWNPGLKADTVFDVQVKKSGCSTNPSSLNESSSPVRSSYNHALMISLLIKLVTMRTRLPSVVFFATMSQSISARGHKKIAKTWHIRNLWCFEGCFPL